MRLFLYQLTWLHFKMDMNKTQKFGLLAKKEFQFLGVAKNEIQNFMANKESQHFLVNREFPNI
jgi:hypothetical protein